MSLLWVEQEPVKSINDSKMAVKAVKTMISWTPQHVNNRWKREKMWTKWLWAAIVSQLEKSLILLAPGFFHVKEVDEYADLPKPIITDDETWTSGYYVHTKAQASQRRHFGLSTPKETWQVASYINNILLPGQTVKENLKGVLKVISKSGFEKCSDNRRKCWYILSNRNYLGVDSDFTFH